MTERDRNIAVIDVAIRTANDDVLQGLYALAGESRYWTAQQILSVWYRQTPIESFTDEQLNELYRWLCQPTSVAELTTWDANKQEFLNTLPSAARAATASRLKAVRNYEVAIGTEACNMNSDQLARMLSGTGIYVRSSLRNILNAVTSYTKWRHSQGHPVHPFLVDTQRPFAKLNIDIRPGMLQSLVFGHQDLYGRIICGPDVKQSYTTPVVAVLLFLGFSVEEMLTIRNDEVDLEASPPTVRSRAIPGDLYRVIQHYMSIQSVERSAGPGLGMRVFYVDNRGLLIRRLVTKSDLEGKPITPTMLKGSYKAGPNAGTMSDLLYSGCCCRLYEKEQRAPLTKEDFATEFGGSADHIRDAMVEYEVFRSIMQTKA